VQAQEGVLHGQITNDWGGKAYVDVMNGVDYALKKYPFADGTRMAAAGGSTAATCRLDRDATRAVQSDREPRKRVRQGFVYATEELWFEEHDMQGTPWTNPESYRKWAPVSTRESLENTRRRRW